MTPERAFFVQARSDLEAAIRLEATRCDNCQILHALQMAVEKTAKGYAQRFGTFKTVHNAFSTGFPRIRVALLADSSVRRRMGLTQRTELSRVLRSVARTATAVEALNPTVAGKTNPNCEYPWTDPGGTTHAPARHRFGKAVGRVARLKLERFLDHVLARELRMKSLLAQ
ncbi:MAG: hypothetical protein KC776_33020 [Myxococcales bacterium]|nr:hypothetical protein [Myxococcales bacterium]